MMWPSRTGAAHSARQPSARCGGRQRSKAALRRRMCSHASAACHQPPAPRHTGTRACLLQHLTPASYRTRAAAAARRRSRLPSMLLFPPRPGCAGTPPPPGAAPRNTWRPPSPPPRPARPRRAPRRSGRSAWTSGLTPRSATCSRARAPTAAARCATRSCATTRRCRRSSTRCRCGLARRGGFDRAAFFNAPRRRLGGVAAAVRHGEMCSRGAFSRWSAASDGPGRVGGARTGGARRLRRR